MIIDNDFSKTILENLYDGVYFVDCDRKILYWNKGAENITGYTSPEVIGKRCSDNITQIDDSGVQLCMTTCPLAKTVELNMQTKLDEMRRYGRPFGILFMDRSVIFLCEQASRPC
ncbi:MAG: PAS domain-containing protein [Candidatus Brocadiaceae bacterium]|nr:PAS domain-containing protein [Candidatus Brocadiaceae bacterium]